MKPLKTVFLDNDKDLFVYQQKVKNVLGIEFPISYLKQGKVRAFLDNNNQIVGGYAMILEAPFRTLSSIPEEVTNLPCEVSELSEVTAMWIDRSVTSGVARCQFWIHFSRDLSTLPGKSHYMYAYDLEKTKLKKLYRFANPTVLFEGRTLLLEGMSEESDESVEVASCRTIMFLPFYALPNLINRLFLRKPINDIRYFLAQRELRKNT
jgi:hypothetical protein